MTGRPKTIRKPAHRCGLTLIEVVMSTLLVGTMLVGATDLLGSVISGRSNITDRVKGLQLAEHLMTEILSRKYKDDLTPTFGPESGEVVGLRSSYDDVDDYTGWMSVTPARLDGTPLSNVTGWERDVTVEWVDPNDLATISVTDQGLKRITVIVSFNGNEVARLAALRSDKYTTP